ncbi:MAG: TetR/AcrR family transcriptional regulator [Gammaproteobacteria bacterium]|nr:TetR/AcrR family transcriptional regulator [Gammaproteobacteria bacterium]MDH3759156.1 TetR/AcrR family transcriptional regulator [Gammaproteobacteria bacterium]
MARQASDTRFELQKGRMLRAAAKCFNEKGYSGSSLKDVANILGLTDAALYYYVKNKEELVYLCYLRAGDVGRESLDMAIREGNNGLDIVRRYLRYHLEVMTGERGPIAIMSEIPSLEPEHRDRVLEISRQHSARFESILRQGIEDGSIAPCEVRMTGNAIMGALNWVPKWFRGDADVAASVVEEFPQILSAGLTP